MRAKLNVGADGRIALPRGGAEALGLADGAEVELVGARGGFALVTPASGEGPRAWFAGSLSSLTVPEVSTRSSTRTCPRGRPERMSLAHRSRSADGTIPFRQRMEPSRSAGSVEAPKTTCPSWK